MIGNTQIDLSNYATKADTVLDTTLSRGRKANTTVGTASIAFGVDAEASGYYSTAIGLNTSAVSQGAFAEGKNTTAHYIAHAEGENTEANGSWAHSEGVGTVANGAASHAGGDSTIANGHSSFVTGRYNAADSYDNWAFWAANTSYDVGDKVKREQLVNNEPTIIGYICKEANTDETFTISHWDFDSNHMNYSVIVGNGYEAEDSETHEVVRHGSNAYALDWDGNGHFAGDVYVGANADSTGGEKLVKESDVPVESGSGVGSVQTKAFVYSGVTFTQTAEGVGSFAEGIMTTASGNYSHAEGNVTTASGTNSHAEGQQTIASGNRAHAEGNRVTASGANSHAEGYYTTSSGANSHAEGYYTTASASRSHAEGWMTGANGMASHSEGGVTDANGNCSHAEGSNTIANGESQHVEGVYNVPDSFSNWPEWVANTVYSVDDKVKITTTVNNETTIEGYICQNANSDAEFTTANWTKNTTMNYAHIVGNGSAYGTSNAYALDWSGNGHYAGDIYINCNNDSTGGEKLVNGLKVVRLI